MGLPMSVDLVSILNKMAKLNFKVFADRDFDMNVVGIRRLPGTPNKFDDLMCLFWKQNGLWQFRQWRCTTDPGGKYLGTPMNPSVGTAVLKHDDQFPGSHKIGVHGASKSWAHPALVQVGVLRVWHDNDRDNVVDYGLAQTTSNGTSGINLHRDLGDFSAGCQVFERRADQEEFMALVKLQDEHGLGDTFTYTLLSWPTAEM